jgi:phage tail-like protein
MARDDDPRFAQFNFLVDLGDDTTTGPHAGFRECTNLGSHTVVDWREGTETTTRAVGALNRPTSVTLKRGVIGAGELHGWLAASRDGSESARRTVRIALMSEDRTSALRTWTLQGARIIRYVSGAFNAKATDVGVEELALSCERIELDE